MKSSQVLYCDETGLIYGNVVTCFDHIQESLYGEPVLVLKPQQNKANVCIWASKNQCYWNTPNPRFVEIILKLRKDINDSVYILPNVHGPFFVTGPYDIETRNVTSLDSYIFDSILGQHRGSFFRNY